MRVSLQWLQELVDCDPDSLAPESLAERLSVAGFEVESIDDLAAQAAGVVVGRVLSRDPHPNADSLSVCRVDVGAAAPGSRSRSFAGQRMWPLASMWLWPWWAPHCRR